MFLAFVGFLCLNSIYPTILLAVPSVKWVRRGAAMMDAVLDIAYTSTYLIITLLAIHELQLDQAIQGNFGDEASGQLPSRIGPGICIPIRFFGFFAVYYSLAHVCTVCRALERSDRLTYWKKLQSLPNSASQSLSISPRFCSKRYRICSKALHFCCIGFIGFVLCCLCNFQSIVFSQPVDTICHVSISKPLNLPTYLYRGGVLLFSALLYLLHPFVHPQAYQYNLIHHFLSCCSPASTAKGVPGLLKSFSARFRVPRSFTGPGFRGAFQVFQESHHRHLRSKTIGYLRLGFCFMANAPLSYHWALMDELEFFVSPCNRCLGIRPVCWSRSLLYCFQRTSTRFTRMISDAFRVAVTKRIMVQSTLRAAAL